MLITYPRKRSLGVVQVSRRIVIDEARDCSHSPRTLTLDQPTILVGCRSHNFRRRRQDTPCCLSVLRKNQTGFAPPSTSPTASLGRPCSRGCTVSSPSCAASPRTPTLPRYWSTTQSSRFPPATRSSPSPRPVPSPFVASHPSLRRPPCWCSTTRYPSSTSRWAASARNTRTPTTKSSISRWASSWTPSRS